MSDYLSDEEQLTKLKQWWADNGLGLVVGLVVAIAAVVGWRWYQDDHLERAESASDAYRTYLNARNAGDPTEALAAVIETEHSGSAYHVFASLYSAKDAAEEEDWDAAAGHLRRAIELADEAVLQDLARVRLARVQYQLDDLDAALQTLTVVHSAGFLGDVAELTGDIHLVRGEQSLAREAYQAAVDASPGAPTLPILELKLASLSKDS